MALTDGLLGPVLGGVLGFVGAVVAALIAYALTQRGRIRRADEESTRHHAYELDFGMHRPRAHIRGAIRDGDRNVHYGRQQFMEYWRAFEGPCYH
ncbi:hypothetical protein F5Y18DRAFT_396634 [Xylariaceae sp. FL1019]|nr:hypothetical protein F5Y18DRAFT_396634 [Xylariaceae sp. FL1019]